MSQILPIAKRGEPVLQQRAEAVADLSDPTIQTLIDDMLTTVLDANGVGIAAPQVFQPLRIIIVASHPNPRYPDAPHMQPVVMINPQIVWQSDACCTGEEGCLSVPDFRAQVERAERIRVAYLDRDGNSRAAEYNGFIARIVQHECDHLDGILFPERIKAKSATAASIA